MADGSGGLARVATVRNRLADQGPIAVRAGGRRAEPQPAQQVLRRPPDGRGAQRGQAGLRHLRQPRVRARRSTRSWPGSPSPNFKWISSNCAQADGTPFPKVLPWDTRPGLGAQGRPLRAHPPGRLPAATYRCTDPDSAAPAAIDTLSRAGRRPDRRAHPPEHRGRPRSARAGAALDLILGGHEHEAHDSIGLRPARAQGRRQRATAQFVTLWGGKGKWRQAVGLVQIDNRLPDDTAVARGRAADGTTACAPLGPERVVGRTACRSTPATRSAGGGSRCWAIWSPTRCARAPAPTSRCSTPARCGSTT